MQRRQWGGEDIIGRSNPIYTSGYDPTGNFFYNIYNTCSCGVSSPILPMAMGEKLPRTDSSSKKEQKDMEKQSAIDQRTLEQRIQSQTTNLFRGINAGLTADDARYLDQNNAEVRVKISYGVSAADQLRMRWAKDVQMPGYYRSHPYRARNLLNRLGLLPEFLFHKQVGPAEFPGVPIDSAHVAISSERKNYVHPERKSPLPKETASILDFYNHPLEEILQNIVNEIDGRLRQITESLKTEKRNAEKEMLHNERKKLCDQRGQIIAAKIWLKDPSSFHEIRLLSFLNSLGDNTAKIADGWMEVDFTITQENRFDRRSDDFFDRQYALRDDLHSLRWLRGMPKHEDGERQAVNIMTLGVESYTQEQRVCEEHLELLLFKKNLLKNSLSDYLDATKQTIEKYKEQKPNYWSEILPDVRARFEEAGDPLIRGIAAMYQEGLNITNECQEIDKQINVLMQRQLLLGIQQIRFDETHGILPPTQAHPVEPNPDPADAETKQKLAEQKQKGIQEAKKAWLKLVLERPPQVLREHAALRREVLAVFKELHVDTDNDFTPVERALLSVAAEVEDAPSALSVFQEAVKACQKTKTDSMIRLSEDPISRVEINTKWLDVRDIQRQLGNTELETVPVDSSQEIWITIPGQEKTKITFGALLDCVRHHLGSESPIPVTRTQARIFLVEILRMTEEETVRKGVVIQSEKEARARDVALSVDSVSEEYPFQGKANRGFRLRVSMKDGVYKAMVITPDGKQQDILGQETQNIDLMLTAFHRIPVIERFWESMNRLSKEIGLFGNLLEAFVASRTKTKEQCESLQIRAHLLYGEYERSGIAQGTKIDPELKNVANEVRKSMQYVSFPQEVISFVEQVEILDKAIQEDHFGHIMRGAERVTTDTPGKMVEEEIIPFLFTIIGGVWGAKQFVKGERWVTYFLRRGNLGSVLERFAASSRGRGLIMGTMSNLGLGTGSYLASEAYKIFLTQGLGRRNDSDVQLWINGELTHMEYVIGVAQTITFSAAMSGLVGWLGDRAGIYVRSAVAKVKPGEKVSVCTYGRNLAFRSLLRISNWMNKVTDHLEDLLPGARQKVEEGIRHELAEEGSQQALQQYGDDFARPFVSALISNDYGIASQILGNAIAVVWAMNGKRKRNRAGIVISKMWKKTLLSSDKKYYGEAYVKRNFYRYDRFSTYFRDPNRFPKDEDPRLRREATDILRDAGLRMSDGTLTVQDDGTHVLTYKKNGHEFVHEFRPSSAPPLLRELHFASFNKDGKSALEAFGFHMDHDKGKCWFDGSDPRKLKGIKKYLYYQEMGIDAVDPEKTGQITKFVLVHVPTDRFADVEVRPPIKRADLPEFRKNIQ